MPYCITVAGDIQQCFPDFATARSDIQELRNQGQKPRLYYSTSFAHLGCEIDDNGCESQTTRTCSGAITPSCFLTSPHPGQSRMMNCQMTDIVLLMSMRNSAAVNTI